MININKLEIPCTYQGGKQRLAKDIVNIMFNNNIINNKTKFFDICCGSGAITIELINQGIHPSNIIMIDSECFGEFWNSIANKEFDLKEFKEEIDKLPSIELIKEYLFNISKQRIDKNRAIYQYILMQSGSFGGKAIWKENSDKWCTSSFRSYWLPTETSNRRSPVNPMMPMPNTLYVRVENIVNELGGRINAIHNDIFNVLHIFNDLEDNNAIIYIDPPYMNTSGYGNGFNIYKLIDEIHNEHNDVPIYISEGFRMDNCKDAYLVSKGRSKGNINGKLNKEPTEEWLNLY